MRVNGLERRYAGGVSAVPRTPCVRQGAAAGVGAVQYGGTVGWRGKEDLHANLPPAER
mgnify:FL=1